MQQARSGKRLGTTHLLKVFCTLLHHRHGEMAGKGGGEGRRWGGGGGPVDPAGAPVSAAGQMWEEGELAQQPPQGPEQQGHHPATTPPASHHPCYRRGGGASPGEKGGHVIGFVAWSNTVRCHTVHISNAQRLVAGSSADADGLAKRGLA